MNETSRYVLTAKTIATDWGKDNCSVTLMQAPGQKLKATIPRTIRFEGLVKQDEFLIWLMAMPIGDDAPFNVGVTFHNGIPHRVNGTNLRRIFESCNFEMWFDGRRSHPLIPTEMTVRHAIMEAKFRMGLEEGE